MDKLLTANAVLSIFAKNYTELKHGQPVRPSEMGLLNIITETEGPHTPLMLAELLGVSKPRITAHISSLEDKGYITKEICTEDKRAYYVHPTEKGFELVKWARADMNEKLKKLVDGLGSDGFDMLISLAEKANRIMEANR